MKWSVELMLELLQPSSDCVTSGKGGGSVNGRGGGGGTLARTGRAESGIGGSGGLGSGLGPIGGTVGAGRGGPPFVPHGMASDTHSSGGPRSRLTSLAMQVPFQQSRGRSASTTLRVLCSAVSQSSRAARRANDKRSSSAEIGVLKPKPATLKGTCQPAAPK
jgi:hypothetical protein